MSLPIRITPSPSTLAGVMHTDMDLASLDQWLGSTDDSDIWLSMKGLKMVARARQLSLSETSDICGLADSRVEWALEHVLDLWEVKTQLAIRGRVSELFRDGTEWWNLGGLGDFLSLYSVLLAADRSQRSVLNLDMSELPIAVAAIRSDDLADFSGVFKVRLKELVDE